MKTTSLPPAEEMYGALVRRDGEYEGIFTVAVRTTGIFCRPTCPARKPKRENVEFFGTVREALLAGYRPCKRCHPLEAADAAPAWIRDLLVEVEEDPTQRWSDTDLRERGLDPTRVRRWFQRAHGMTFHSYHRSRRLGAALGRIRQGADLTDTACAAGYESPSAFREAFQKLFGAPPGAARDQTRVVVNRVSTPLGAMVVGATDTHLCLLEFGERRMLQTQIERLRKYLDASFAPGDNDVLAQTQAELVEYFAGTRRQFEIPLLFPGTDFQRAAWEALQKIPYGTTRSYSEQARLAGRPQAVRAIGKANGDNRLSIVIPCHRVVGANGDLVGYGGELWRKKALLELERGVLESAPG